MLVNTIYFDKTIREEYKNLINSQKEVKMGMTPKKLDEFVYDKSGGIKNVAICLSSSFATGLLFHSLFYDKNLSKLPKFVKAFTAITALVLDGYVIKMLKDDAKNKQEILNNPFKKRDLYRKRGINAVV